MSPNGSPGFWKPCIAVDQAQHTLDAVLAKTRFWQRWATTPLNERQVKLVNQLLDGFEGKLTSSK
jgi:Fic family protein